MLAAFRHQKAIQVHLEAHLEKKIVRQCDERARAEGLLGSVRRNRDGIQMEVQTLSEQLAQALKQIGDLTVELGQNQQTTCEISSPEYFQYM